MVTWFTEVYGKVSKNTRLNSNKVRTGEKVNWIEHEGHGSQLHVVAEVKEGKGLRAMESKEIETLL